MNINPSSSSSSSSISGSYRRSDQTRPAESPKNGHPESSTAPGTSNLRFNTGRENLQGLISKMERCAPSASPEAIPAEASSTQFRELPDAIQSLIVEKAAVISRRPEESAQNLAQLAVVNRAFRSFSHDIQETHPDIKQAGARARQKAVSRRISDILILLAGLTTSSRLGEIM